MDQREEQVICPWCHTEIVWDEEIGPEEFCPHCENELKSYRTIKLDLDNERDPDEDEEADEDEDERGEARPQRAARPSSPDNDGLDGFLHVDARLVAAERKLEAMLDRQEEMPECPSCRGYMLEAGTQTVGPDGYEPAAQTTDGQALLAAPFRVVWYLCPSCFHMESRLSSGDRELLLERLNEQDD